MNLMLDIHGVLDKNPEVFTTLARTIRWWGEGSEVHIVTGESISQNLIDQLLSYNQGEQYWDALVSIQDELIKSGAKILSLNEFGRPTFSNEEWDSFKGRYCAEHNIDLAIDDSEEYAKYFDPNVTTFLLHDSKRGK